ncbi:MAG: hypothetical protein ACRDY5_09140, partial [Acidimicrobiales bacterium]
MTGFPPPGAAGLVSVDVFDTVLVRRVGHPDGVFLLLGRQQAARQLTALAPEAFARARKDAQNRAHAAHRERVSHGHILAELGWALSLTAAQVEDLRSCELAIESAIMTAVPGAASWLDQLRDKAGGRVVFVSDTYFPAAFLRSLLEEQGMWQDGDGLYVSCEAGREKHTGRLLPVMARREGVARRLVHHYGNDAVADVSAARRAGVRATLVAEANLNRYEEILDRWRLPTGGLASLMAGASRLARLSVPAASDIDAAIRDVTAGVIAPTLVAYVLWVLADAARTGVRRLYFVSRDGEVLLRVARRLVDRTGSPAGLELRYLHGSRQAW